MTSTDPIPMRDVLRFVGPLPAPCAARLYNSLLVHDLQAGDILFWTGSEGGSVFFVESGELSIWWESDEGSQELGRYSAAGDMVTPGALLDRSPRKRSCLAAQDARVIELTSTAFEHLTRLDPSTAAQVLESLATAAANHPDSDDPATQTCWLDTFPEVP